MTHELLLAGFGGQGILFAGKLLAYVGLYSEKEVSWLPSYGPEMRGGTCNCSVTISDSPIGSPLILEPNELLVMNTPSFDKFIGAVKAGGIAVIDSTLVEGTTDRTDIKCFYIPATKLAADNNLKGMANIILAGKLLKESGLTDEAAIEKALKKVIPPKKAELTEANMTALKLGMSL
ncbi:MAG: 2-oxoacid:acceptor oxidoreductase family protein [Ruminiclostridium sp.]